ncbi:ABC transporter ATP-binding protein [Aurantimonas sp. C2-3-R2]|uniref:ABC transporter ATP-binding protein n=1 Tax=unclassified Aurantimonas TaxID=2638230 RepID=UPI003FA4CD66
MTAEEKPLVAEFRGVTKRFGAVVAARDIDLAIVEGEFLSLLGPSGCGKTTTLRMIAGFEQPTEGDVLLLGQRINGVPAYRRQVNMVFQHYALFPHLNVEDNVAYGLRQRRPRPAKKELERAVAEVLELVRLAGYQNRRIWEMSGGQQQRVALARALINKPKLLLLDEPLAALDRKLRREMQFELQNLQRTLGISFVLVTHDQEEALSMSDRVCIMREGHLVQTGAPRELYDQPANRYVADFVGRSNIFDGVVTENGARVELVGGISVSPADGFAHSPGQKVAVSVRPEQLRLARDATRIEAGADVLIEARVLNRIFLGEHTEYLLRHEWLGEFLALAPRRQELGEKPFEAGEPAHVAWGREANWILAS